MPKSTRLAMTRDANHGGDVVLIDRENGGARLQLERPPTRNGQGVSKAAFGRVAVTQDGRKIAAATAAGQVEMVCVWDVAGGPPRVFRGHSRPITAVSFSGDGRSLLTASEDGTAKLWDLAAGPGANAPGPGLEHRAGAGTADHGRGGQPIESALDRDCPLVARRARPIGPLGRAGQARRRGPGPWAR